MNLRITILLVALIFPALGQAVEAFGKTPGEKAMCAAKMRDYDPNKVANKKNVGHMHHYCDCLRFRYRALKYPASHSAYKHNVREAMGGCNYVLKHTTSDFYMRPHVYVARGEVQMIRKNLKGAAQDFLKALELDASFEPAFIKLSDVYRKQKNTEMALKTVSDGLKLHPSSKALKRRYTRLGGKEPFPGQVATK